MSEKRVELCKVRAGDIKTGFGNPRKIGKKNMEDLEASLKTYGDFGIFVLDEDYNIIAGNQRLKAVLNTTGPDTMLDCKRLIGYTDAELKAINIKDNCHAGVWDLDMLADWTADVVSGFDIKEVTKKDAKERKIDQMELVAYERYDYVIIACRTKLDYINLTNKLGLLGKKAMITNKRSIQARAVWFEDIQDILFGTGGAPAPAVPETAEEGE